jgi:hypothetical protein
MTRTLLLVILISLVGGMFMCYEPTPGPEYTGPYSRALTDAEVAAVRLRQPLPVFVDSTTCSPRCCNYGLWTTTDFIILFERPDSASPKVGAIKQMEIASASEGIMRVSGNRFVTDVALPPHFAVGDTLDVYTPRGDGFFRARRTGTQDELVEVQLRYREPDGNSVAGRFFGDHRYTWWVLVSAPGGRGWTAEIRDFTGPRFCHAPPRRR